MNTFNASKRMGALLASTSMALFASGAMAGTFTFTQTGFNDGATINGFFKAQDLNHDGLIAGAEIWDLRATIIGGFYDGFAFAFNPTRYRPHIVYNLGSGVLGNHPGDALDVYAPQQIGWSVNGTGGVIYDGFGQYPSAHYSQLVQINEPTAIPEPGSWAMLLGGLGLLGLMKRRQPSVASQQCNNSC